MTRRDPATVALEVVDVHIVDLDRTLTGHITAIAENVDMITQFLGKSAELQAQTQNKIDRLTDGIEDLKDAIAAQDAKWDQRMHVLSVQMEVQNQQWNQRIETMAAAVNGYQQTAQSLIQLATAITQKAS